MDLWNSRFFLAIGPIAEKEGRNAKIFTLQLNKYTEFLLGTSCEI